MEQTKETEKNMRLLQNIPRSSHLPLPPRSFLCALPSYYYSLLLCACHSFCKIAVFNLASFLCLFFRLSKHEPEDDEGGETKSWSRESCLRNFTTHQRHPARPTSSRSSSVAYCVCTRRIFIPITFCRIFFNLT